VIFSIRDKLLTWSDQLEERAKSLQALADGHASEGRAICAGLVNAQVRKLLKESQAKRKRARYGVTL
jgi:hypothetical protein